MKAADRSGAALALVLGDRDIADGTVGIKNLATGDQESVSSADVVARVGAILGA